jgi:O-antigen/teichoic acid export membrane protein
VTGPLEPVPGQDAGAAALRGGLLSAATGVLKQVMSGVATFVLARLLAPDELGQVAAANSVMLVVSTIGLLGFNVSILRTPRDDRRATSTILALQLAAGALGAACLLGGAGPLSRMVGLEDADLVRALSVVLLLQGISGGSRSILLRDRRYRTIYGIDLAEAILYLVAQIGLALIGWGPWAVVVSQAGTAVFATVALARAARWWVPTVVDRAVVRRVLGFGAALFGGSTLSTLAKNADYWFVGRRLGIAALGAYYVAYVLPTILRQRVTWAANEALLPLVTTTAGDRAIDRRRFLVSLRLHALVGFPMCVGLAIVSPDVVRVGFGADYGAATRPMQVIALAAIAEFLLQATATQLTGSGRGAPSVVLGAVRLVVLGVGLGLVVALDGGLAAVAGAVAGSIVVSWLVGVVWIGRVASVSGRDHLAEIAPAALAAVAMAAVAVGAGSLLDGWPPWARLAVVVAVGAASYLPALALAGAVGRAHLRWLLATARRVARKPIADEQVAPGIVGPG